MTTRTGLQNAILTSIYGRRLGLNANEFLVGPKEFAKATQALTSGSTGTAVINYGITSLDVTTGAASTASSVGTTEIGCAWVMDAPEPGVRKTIYKASSSGGSTMPVVCGFGTGVTAFDSSLGSTFTGMMMLAVGNYLTLEGLSTSKWLVVGKSTATSLASSN